ncbi:MAG: ankyrin repeat domain-containing protein [Planctomycetaceae bacterium]|jgi:ankyrin repeat protein|nr:ankyrin repeat domain-containing protein [Planctomycetaceae bacterium]
MKKKLVLGMLFICVSTILTGCQKNNPAKSEDTNIQTKFLQAVEKGSLDEVKILVSQGADVKTPNNYGWTPLHVAAFTNSNVDVFKFLIEKGADVNAKTNNGATPIHRAAKYNPNIAVLKFLIDKGADVNATNKDGKTPLELANTEKKKIIIRDAGGKLGKEISVPFDEKAGTVEIVVPE